MPRKLVAALALLAGISAITGFAGSAAAQKRVALVVGNSAYQHTPKLTNPRNDATDMAAALKRHAFQVIEGFDLDKAGFDRKVRDFANTLEGGAVGVFFYAGHGISVAGQSYLVPVDAQLTTAAALEFEMVRVDVVHRVMERLTTTNVLFLDACRDNPLSRNLARSLGTRSTEIGKGLAPIESGVGTLISFSTHPGAVASDGAGRNSPYAGALVKHLASSNDDLSAILIAVRNDVMTETQRKQVPWEHSALTGRFYFNPAAQTADPAKVAPARLSEAAEAWGATKDTTNIAVLEAFIARYKETFYAELARARIEELKKQQVAVAKTEAKKEPAPKGVVDQTLGLVLKRTEPDAARKKYEDEARDKAEAERQRLAMLRQEQESKRAQALGFPAKPITLIVPWPAGGSSDIVMRSLAEATQKHLGQPMIIENKPGASGTLGPAQMAATSKSDGYTIAQIPITVFRLPYMSKATFDPAKDFTFIIGLTGYTFGVVVRKDAPWQTFEEMIQHAKANPGAITYATPGSGTSLHIGMEQIARLSGVTWTHVPFRGSAETNAGLLGGHVHAVADATGWRELVKSGEFRLLVTWGATRTHEWPDVPTLKELGIDLVANSPYGIAGPKNMDPAIVKVLHDAFAKGVREATYAEALRRYDQELAYLPTADYAKHAVQQMEEARKIVDELGLKSR